MRNKANNDNCKIVYDLQLEIDRLNEKIHEIDITTEDEESLKFIRAQSVAYKDYTDKEIITMSLKRQAARML